MPHVADLREQCFGEIVRPHLPHLVSRARTILGCEDLAWDAVQETLVSLWSEVEFPENLHGWLLRAVVYRSLHLSRTRRRRRKHEAAACCAHCEESRRDDPEVIVADRELRTLVEEAVATLPDDFRRVFVLREVDRLDYEAIAELLDIPLGTVRSRLNRARAAPRESVQGVLFPSEERPETGCRSSQCGCVQGQRPLEN